MTISPCLPGNHPRDLFFHLHHYVYCIRDGLPMDIPTLVSLIGGLIVLATVVAYLGYLMRSELKREKAL